jgi:hypothetical protein
MQSKNIAIIGLSSIFIVSLSSSCGRHKGRSAAALPGTWQSLPIVIDGDSRDWPSPYPNYDSRALVAYATSNDKKNLYITLESGDEMTQMKILKQGLTVSIDTGGKKNPEFHINYPLQNDNDPLEFPRKEDLAHTGKTTFMQREMDSKLKKGASDANQLSLDGFPNCNGGFMTSQTTPCGIKVVVRIDEFSELVWEAVVPFKAIYNIDTITAAYAGKPVTVCYAVKAFKYPESKTSGDGSSNSMSNGMGSGGGMGGRGGGGRGGNMGSKGSANKENPMQHLYEATKTWKQFGVAYRQ